MSILFYAVCLIFFMIPLNVRAYLNLKNGRVPLPRFQNNIVVSRIKVRNKLGVFSSVLFWGFHVLFAVWALDAEAWIASLAAVAYMVISPMLTGQMKAKSLRVESDVAVPGGLATE
jgi:hypothetical protein